MPLNNYRLKKTQVQNWKLKLSSYLDNRRSQKCSELLS